jgi:PIN domain nuclease of toxin-antitoxin system
MKLLLDTHIFLCYITGDAKLPAHIRDSIRDRSNDAYLSVVSIWESIVKNQLGKVPLPQPAEVYLPTQRDYHKIASLPLDEASVMKLRTLPHLHRDPFDPMLLCHALEKRRAKPHRNRMRLNPERSEA